MSQFENHLHIQCRLCSSKVSLISLFKGKNKQNRNYIRKLVELTIGIQYEENDYFDCICLSCVISIYNSFIFKIKSIENEERLKSLVPDKIPNHKTKKPVEKLKDIESPQSSSSKNKVLRWLLNKQEILFSEQSENTSSGRSENSKEFMDNYTQTDSPNCFNVSIQTVCKPAILKSNMSTQTEPIENDVENESEVNYCERGIQCNISERNTDIFNLAQFISKKNNDSMCFFQNTSFEFDKNLLSNKLILNNEQIKNDCFHMLLKKLLSFETKNKNNFNSVENNFLKCCDELNKQLECIRKKNQLGLEFHLLSPKSMENLNKNKELLKDTEVGRDVHYDEMQDEVTTPLKPLTIICSSIDIKEEQKSPSLNNVIQLKSSPISPCASPSFESLESLSDLNLLKVSDKVDNLNICVECDLPLYSKSELAEHVKNHMICSLCHKKFRTVKTKKNHFQQCAMNNLLPTVKLERVDSVEAAAKIYINLNLTKKQTKKTESAEEKNAVNLLNPNPSRKRTKCKNISDGEKLAAKKKKKA